MIEYCICKVDGLYSENNIDNNYRLHRHKTTAMLNIL